MKKSILIVAVLLFLSITIQAQKEEIITDASATNKILTPQATGDDVIIKDESSNTLFRVIDEGSFGSLELKSGVPSTTTNKIYNNSGTLHFNGTTLGPSGASVINDLGDAWYDGNSLYLGVGAGINDDASDNYNTAVGTNALHLNTTGNSNTAIGYLALGANITKHGNTAIGYHALGENNGDHNTATGVNALGYNTTGNYNTANGYWALHSNTIGSNNTAVGYEALVENSDGNYNTAIGNYSLNSNTTGDYNTANGVDALNSNTSGNRNTATGYQALYENETGYNNVGNGHSALFSNTTGYRNTATGNYSLHSNTNGYNNTANGYNALYNNTDGHWNTAIGSYALNSNTIGIRNTANGYCALFDNTTSSYNTAIGYFALTNSTGGSNTAVGYSALGNNTTGPYNTAIGANSGPTSSFPGLENTTALGYGARPMINNEIVLGNSSVVSIGGYAHWTDFSDARYKKNIRNDVAGLEFILGLHPITYNLDIDKLSNDLQEDYEIDKDGNRIRIEPSAEIIEARQKKAIKREVGFVAQEVEELANNLGFDFSGVEVPENEQSMYRLRYAEFVVPIVKAMQEQQEIIEELRNRITQLETDKRN